LGFFLGWVLLRLSAEGHWAAALILALYYLSDNALTMVPRVFRVRRFWEPHREHFYQQAVVRGTPHSTVVLTILVGNVILVALAVLAEAKYPVVALVLSALVTALVLATVGRLGNAPRLGDR
jgi:UDP-N-acetylmuramyl pentapeptide phosphotransferase/UDP-N-acetylglucosamine-1-phosphate transferase